MNFLKTYQLVLAFCLAVPTLFFSQHPINALKLDSGEWRVNKVAGGPSGPASNYDYYYKLCGDTLINGMPYKRVFAAIHNVMSGPPQSLVFQPHGDFRQDSLAKRSYYHQMSVNTDSLIMDYNLNLGDTIKGGFYSYMLPPNLSVIVKIDSVVFGSIKHKVLFTDTVMGISNPAGIWFLEGVGNVCGFLEPIVIPLSGYGTFLQSFTENYSCSDVSSIQDLQGSKGLFVYPNPVVSELHVSTPLFIRNMIVYDITGKKVKEFTAEHDVNVFSLPVTELEKGVYYTRFFFIDGTSITSTFMK